MSRIMVVDDDPDLRLTLARALRQAGHEVRAANTGLAALLAMRENPPDVLLTDLAMAEGDGVMLIRQCRADPRLATVGVIVMSGRPDGATVAARERAQGFLLKPFPPMVAVAAVNAALIGKRARAPSTA